MRVVKLMVVNLLGGLAARDGTLAMAEGPNTSGAHASVADSTDQSVLLANGEGRVAGHTRSADTAKRATNVNAHKSEPVAPLPDLRSTQPCDSMMNDCGHAGYCGPTCRGPCPTIYGQVDALFLKREPHFANQPIIVDPNTNTTFLSTSNLGYDFDPGMRAMVGKRLCSGRALEFTYFGLFQGSASAFAVAPDDDSFLTFPDNLVGNVFVDIDRADVDYNSSLHSFELNLVCCKGCCCSECRGTGGCDSGGCDGGGSSACHNQCGSGIVRCRTFEWFAGFRYINLDEEFNILVQGPITGEAGSYNIRTDNRLYGGQLGARLRRSRGRFGWEGTGKAGIYGNDSQQTQSVTDFPNFPLRPTVSSSQTTVAFVGEANLSAFFALTDVWNLRAGYTAMWIEGLALGPDQLDFDFAAAQGGSQLDNGGSMFLHGVNVGLEARW